MKPIPDLDDLLARANAKGIFGTKMRSVIKLANPDGVNAVVDQQFEIGRRSSPPAWFRSSSPRSTSTAREGRRRSPAQGPTSRTANALADDQFSHVEADPPEEDNFYTDSSSTRRFCASSPCRAATAAKRPTLAQSQPRDDRQLQPRAERGTLSEAERRRVHRNHRRVDRQHLRSLQLRNLQ